MMRFLALVSFTQLVFIQPIGAEFFYASLAPHSQLKNLSRHLSKDLLLGEVLNKRELEREKPGIPISLRLKYSLAEIPVAEFIAQKVTPSDLQMEAEALRQVTVLLRRMYQNLRGIKASRSSTESESSARELAGMKTLVRFLSKGEKSLRIQELLKSLQSRKDHVRSPSLYVLGEWASMLQDVESVETKGVIDRVLDFLGSSVWSDRQGAVEALGKIINVVNVVTDLAENDRHRILQWLKRLLGDEVESIRQASAMTLACLVGKFDTEAQFKVLDEFIGKVEESLRLWQVEGLIGLVDILAKGSDVQKSDALFKLLRAMKSENHYIRRASARALGNMSEVVGSLSQQEKLKIIHGLIEGLTDADKTVRRHSAEALGNLAVVIQSLGDMTRVSEALSSRKRDKDFFVQQAAQTALGRIESGAAPAPIQEQEQADELSENIARAMIHVQSALKHWELPVEELADAADVLHLFFRRGIDLERFCDILRSDHRTELLRGLSCVNEFDIELGDDPEVWADSFRLFTHMAESSSVGLYKPLEDLDQFEKFVHRVLRNPSLGSLYVPYLVANLRLLRDGVGQEEKYLKLREKFWREGISKDVLADLLEEDILRRDLRLAKRILRSIGAVTEDRVYQLKNLVLQLSDAVTGGPTGYDERRGLIGWLRTDMHERASPVDLARALAIRDYITSDGSSQSVSALTLLGYIPTPKDNISILQRPEVLVKLDELIQSLELMYGVGARDGISPDQSRTPLEAIEKLTQTRLVLYQNLSREVGTALIEGMRLDNTLEVELFGLVGVIHQDKSKSPMTFKDKISLLKSLVQNARLSGKPLEEFTDIWVSLEQWEERWNDREVSRSGWLELYRILRKIEIQLNQITEETISHYQKMVENLANQIQVSDTEKVKIENFSADLLRSEMAYPLSTFLNDLKEEVEKKAGKVGWEVVVSGRGVGRVRVIKDLRELRRVEENDIIVLDHLPPEAPPIHQAAGIIAFAQDGLLSHPALRARAHHIPYAVMTDASMRKAVLGLDGHWIAWHASESGVTWEEVSSLEAGSGIAKAKSRVEVPRADIHQTKMVLSPEEYRPEWIGQKAFRLASMDSSPHFSVPFGVFEVVLNLSSNSKISREIKELIQVLKLHPKADDVPEKLKRLRGFINQLEISGEVLDEIHQAMVEKFGGRSAFVRSSSNAEDLPGNAAAGLYASIGGIGRRYELEEAMLKIWASVWNETAFYDREAHGMDHHEVKMALLIHEMIPADYSFVIHTVDPVSKDPNKVVIEVVQGMGESLVNGDLEFYGSPYRMVYHRDNGTLSLEAYPEKPQKVVMNEMGRLVSVPTRYEPDEFLLSSAGLEKLAKVCRRALELEELFGKPQDIEGVIFREGVNIRSTFVQSRDQVFSPVDLAPGAEAQSVESLSALVDRSV